MPVVLENRWSSQGRGGGVTHPLHPPPRFAPVCIHMYVDGTTFKRKCSLGYHHVAWNGKNKTQKLKGLLPPFPHAYHPLYYACSEINLPRDIFFCSITQSSPLSLFHSSSAGKEAAITMATDGAGTAQETIIFIQKKVLPKKVFLKKVHSRSYKLNIYYVFWSICY